MPPVTVISMQMPCMFPLNLVRLLMVMRMLMLIFLPEEDF